MFGVLAAVLLEIDQICQLRLKQCDRTGNQNANLAFSYRERVRWLPKFFVIHPVYVSKHFNKQGQPIRVLCNHHPYFVARRPHWKELCLYASQLSQFFKRSTVTQYVRVPGNEGGKFH